MATAIHMVVLRPLCVAFKSFDTNFRQSLCQKYHIKTIYFITLLTLECSPQLQLYSSQLDEVERISDSCLPILLYHNQTELTKKMNIIQYVTIIASRNAVDIINTVL